MTNYRGDFGKEGSYYILRRGLKMKETFKRSTIVAFIAGVILMVLSSSAWALPADWVHTTATLSEARYRLTATTVGGKALFAGGIRSGEDFISNVVDIYDTDTGLWTTSTLSQARYSLDATTVGNKAMFAGGTIGQLESGEFVMTDTVDIYNGRTEQWSTATLSQARTGLAATTVGQKAIFAGGTFGHHEASNVVDIYDVGTGQWSTATLLQARHSLVATTVGNKALFAGGDAEDGSWSNVVDIYNADTGQWSTATLSEARSNISATTVGNKAIFAGGYRGGTDYESDVVDIYDAETGQWSVATLSEGKYAMGATTLGNEGLFAGGHLHWGPDYTNVVEIFDGDTGLWSTGTQTLSEARGRMVATTVGDQALFAGGCFGDYVRSDVVDIFTITEPVPGDFDGDGGVGGGDLCLWQAGCRTASCSDLDHCDSA